MLVVVVGLSIRLLGLGTSAARLGFLPQRWQRWFLGSSSDPRTRLTQSMALQMKPECERCYQTLAPMGEAFICTFECTFCIACATAMNRICPNCGGELVRRPRKKN